MEGNQDLINYLKALIRISNTEDGKVVLSHLEKLHVVSSSLCEKPEHTLYRLGQKEVIQGLIEDSKRTVEEIDEIFDAVHTRHAGEL